MRDLWAIVRRDMGDGRLPVVPVAGVLMPFKRVRTGGAGLPIPVRRLEVEQ